MAKKIDLTVIQGVPVDQTLAEFVRELMLDSETATLESLEEITVGAHRAVSAVTTNRNDPADRHTTLGFRLAPHMVMLTGVLPETAWGSGDIQGILNSLTFSPEAQVVMPSYAPSAPIIAVPEGCGS